MNQTQDTSAARAEIEKRIATMGQAEIDAWQQDANAAVGEHLDGPALDAFIMVRLLKQTATTVG